MQGLWHFKSGEIDHKNKWSIWYCQIENPMEKKYFMNRQCWIVRITLYLVAGLIAGIEWMGIIPALLSIPGEWAQPWKCTRLNPHPVHWDGGLNQIYADLNKTKYLTVFDDSYLWLYTETYHINIELQNLVEGWNQSAWTIVLEEFTVIDRTSEDLNGRWQPHTCSEILLFSTLKRATLTFASPELCCLRII